MLEALWNIPRSVRGAVVKSTIVLSKSALKSSLGSHGARRGCFFGALHICSEIFLWPEHPHFLWVRGSCGREHRLARIYFLLLLFSWCGRIWNCLLKSDLRQNLQKFLTSHCWGAVTPLSPQTLGDDGCQVHFCLFFRYFGECPGEAAVPEDGIRACRVLGHLCSPQQRSQNPGAPPEIPRQGKFGRQKKKKKSCSSFISNSLKHCRKIL